MPKPRIFFVMAALPHYFKLVLNKLHTQYACDITLIKPSETSLSVGKSVQEDSQNAAFRIINLPEYKTYYGKPFFEGLLPLLEQEKPDIVVMTSWPYFLQWALNPFNYWRFRKIGSKLICRDIPFNMSKFGEAKSYYFGDNNLNEDGTKPKKNDLGYLNFWAITWLRKIYLPLADAHLNYIDEAREIIGSYGIPQEKIFITANSPDTDILEQIRQKISQEEPILPYNPYRLIHVGRLVAWKRVDLLIEAVAQLKSQYPQVELLILGFGPEENTLKQLAKDKKIEANVHFLGGIYEPERLGKYLLSAGIYVLGGMGGLSINDAMAFGKPIICSKADGTEKRLVKEGQNGYFFENGSAKSLKEKIEMLFQNPEKMKDFGQKSLEIIEKEVNIHLVLEEYVKAFRFVMQAQ